ncbi:MAG: hypothetical protein ACE5GS_08255 [Kiloniellaceae bacterium]
MRPRRQTAKRRRLSAFDAFVLAGALVNVTVVVLLFAHWAMQT